MALDQSALLEVLDALRAADADDRVRRPLAPIHQAQVEAELAAVIGTAPHERAGGPSRAVRRAPAPDTVRPGRRSGTADPQAAHGLVPSVGY
jgi:putative transposase